MRAAVRDELTAQRAALQKDVRELCGEMEDVLESFSAVMRREAARRARDVAADLKRRGGEGAETSPADASPAAVEVTDKAALRRMYLVPAAHRGQVAAALAQSAEPESEETGT